MEENNTKQSESSSGFALDIYDWFDTVLYSVLSIIVLFVLFTRMSTVDGSSMLPTLEDKQCMMISDLFYTPERNDIVVVWAENIPNQMNGEMGKAIVKRVIGLPGDTINIDFDNGTVYRNGEALPIEIKDGVLYEDGHMINSYTLEPENFHGEITVPDGCLFVMGDNRNASTDSRSSLVGFIDRREVVGRAYLRVYPFDSFGLL